MNSDNVTVKDHAPGVSASQGMFRSSFAAWQLTQKGEVADHLGQIYDKQGKHAEAVDMWRLAIAASNRNDDARERLRRAGASVEAGKAIVSGKNAPLPISEQLGVLRTVKVPSLPKQTSSAEYFVMVSKKGVEDVRPVDTSASINDAIPAIKGANYIFPFPDDGGEKLVRQGILSCSVYTVPSCQLTFLLPSTTVAARSQGTQRSAGRKLPIPGDIIAPTLRTQVEPEYTTAAEQAHLEGTVLLSIVISDVGVPEEIYVLKSLGMGLDENAKECVKKWRFYPGTKNGKPVRCTAKVEVKFVMLQRPQ